MQNVGGSLGYEQEMTSNPFLFRGPLEPTQMIDRDSEADAILADLSGGHWIRLVGPRRYGKTTLLKRVLADAEREGSATALVDLEDVGTLGDIVVRIERAYNKSLKGKLRRLVEDLFASWGLGVSLGAGGFSLHLQSNPSAKTEGVLVRILELPAELHRRTGKHSIIVFDEVQDLLRVERADGILRSVIQHQGDVAAYAFAGSAPGLVEQLFSQPRRPLLEQAVPMQLDPLDPGDVAAYVRQRFEQTGRDAGEALAPLVEFSRGHPQRSMLLAHHLWRRTPAGGEAEAGTWVAARDDALADSQEFLRATWRGLPVNEQKMALALARRPPALHHQATLDAVGLKKGSVMRAVEGLLARGDAIPAQGGVPRLTDPLVEHWLAARTRA